MDAAVRVLSGRYKIRRKLGEGGMAVVYEAEDEILGRRVALKTLRERYAEDDAFRARFKQEARAMASLDHENVIKVYDISQEDEVPFIVAEYVGGRDVGEMLRRAPGGRLDERRVREIAAELLRALSYAHRHGIIHRDIKPSNILTTEWGMVKVADFGIASIVEEEESSEETGEIIGSARYMSPEQLRGEQTTPRSDVYSVGILLYHCLTGRPPFSGDPKSVARQHVHDEPTPPRELNKKVSAQMEAVVLKAIAKSPGNRYLSASAMLDDLDDGSIPIRVASRPYRKKQRKAWFALGGRQGRAVISAASALVVVLLLSAGTGAASALGYVDLRELSLLGGPAANNEALTPSEPAEPAPSEASRDDSGQEEPEATPESTQQAMVTVPDMDSYFDYYARELLKSQGLESRLVRENRVGYADTGVVWNTDPAPGTDVPAGSTVTIYATPRNGPQIPDVVLPDPSSAGRNSSG